MALLDPHSYTDADQPQTQRLEWRATVDFGARVLEAEVVLHLDREGTELDLDTRDLDVRSVTSADGALLSWRLCAEDPILGRRLAITLAPGVRAVRVGYRTSPASSALQWLEPAQTAGKRAPFLFSQCQAIHARAVVPCQDSPRVRITYRAELTVPARLTSLMAAAFVGRRASGAAAVDTWEMPQAIPPYLLALAVGELVSRDLDGRTRIWAEPETIDAAAWEFEATPSLVAAGEAMFGPYPWDRFDVLVMPPSFPYGGMENPRLTFVTPTLIAGDRTQVSVIAHELAHSWTGNLVTNANAEHFWLNEGWTRYAEIRLVEATEGADVAALHAALGRRGLDKEIERFRDEGRPELTRLRTHLAGVDPDEAFSVIPYDKGYLLLRAVEERVGRARFDAFIKTYIATFAFRAITTEEFVAFADRELPGVLGAIRADEWLFAPGVPPDAPEITSTILDALAARGGTPPDDATAAAWSAREWELWLEWLPRPMPREVLDALHARLDGMKNPEVLVAWLTVAAESGYAPALPRIEQVLTSVGRMKYLRPLYAALAAREATKPIARRIFEQAAPGYHPIARAVMDRVTS